MEVVLGQQRGTPPGLLGSPHSWGCSLHCSRPEDGPRASLSRILSWVLSVLRGLRTSPSGILLLSGTFAGVWGQSGLSKVGGRGRAPGMGPGTGVLKFRHAQDGSPQGRTPPRCRGCGGGEALGWGQWRVGVLGGHVSLPPQPAFA